MCRSPCYVFVAIALTVVTRVVCAQEGGDEAIQAAEPRVEPTGAEGARAQEASRGKPTEGKPQSDEELARQAERARLEANYARNVYAIQLAFGRVILPDITEGYEGRAEFAAFFPEEDGASTMMVVVAGVSGWGSKDSWGFGTPFAFGWGFRTPAFVGYFGPLVGIGFDKNEEPATPSFGGTADLGFDAGGFRLMFDTRAEYRIMKYGHSRWHLGYGALASIDL